MQHIHVYRMFFNYIYWFMAIALKWSWGEGYQEYIQPLTVQKRLPQIRETLVLNFKKIAAL